MRPSLCRTCIASILKLLNFLQAFTGVSVVIYSACILIRWNKHPSIGGGNIGFELDDLPAPWFICVAMGAGALQFLVALTGSIAAEAVSSCCLCFYSIFTAILILLEAALTGYLLFNKHWEEDLPYDPTGELRRLRAFIEDNIDVFKWVEVTVVVIQALSLVLALILRILIPSRRMDYDSDKDFLVIRRPLLNPKGGPFSPTSAADNKGFYSDIWSARMRDKHIHVVHYCLPGPQRDELGSIPMFVLKPGPQLDKLISIPCRDRAFMPPHCGPLEDIAAAEL